MNKYTDEFLWSRRVQPETIDKKIATLEARIRDIKESKPNITQFVFSVLDMFDLELVLPVIGRYSFDVRHDWMFIKITVYI